VTKSTRHPGIAAAMSAVLPGLGQIYNGQIWWAIFWFVVTPGLWIGSGGTLGWICHVVSAWGAYRYAKRRPEV
jgi:TM2 domain-containing membrane protein YozV